MGRVFCSFLIVGSKKSAFPQFILQASRSKHRKRLLFILCLKRKQQFLAIVAKTNYPLMLNIDDIDILETQLVFWFEFSVHLLLVSSSKSYFPTHRKMSICRNWTMKKNEKKTRFPVSKPTHRYNNQHMCVCMKIKSINVIQCWHHSGITHRTRQGIFMLVLFSQIKCCTTMLHIPKKKSIQTYCTTWQFYVSQKIFKVKKCAIKVGRE